MNKAMRILFVIPALGDVYGGPSKTTTDLAQSLADRGLTVDIVTTNANGAKSLDVPIQQWLSKSGYRIQYFAYRNIGDYKWSNTFATWLFHHVADYDLVHSNAVFSLPNLPAHWACQWQKVPYIITPHGMLEPWALSYKARKKHLYYHAFERPALNSASGIQSLAVPEAEHLQDLQVNAPIFIIPNGIHHSEFQTLPDPESFYQQFPHTRNKTLILFLGRIDPKKGLDLLAKAFKSIRHRFPLAHLIIAGSDNIGFLPTAKQYFAEADCLEAVTFTGILTGSIKYSALAAANVYVAPSYSEGFSMSVLEGMASKLPCIITTGCNFEEAAVAEVAYVVDIQAEAIAAALIKCLSDPVKSQAMGDRAHRFILENYTWDKIAEDLIQVYQAILDRKPIPSFINTVM